jgi:4-hydroxy-tetrahydrodipicolinate reductase
MSSFSVMVNGARGRMGQLAVETLQAQSDFSVCATLHHTDHLASAIQHHKPDMVIDFTNANAINLNLSIILENRTRAVIGTTGLTDAEITDFSKLCDSYHLGCMIVPNFSIGAACLDRAATMCHAHFQDHTILEIHHPHKKDAPSGTALRTAKQLGTTTIHAMRLPGVVAEQTVYFGRPGETITITHRVTDRLAYMQGLLQACRRVMTLNHLVVGL